MKGDHGTSYASALSNIYLAIAMKTSKILL